MEYLLKASAIIVIFYGFYMLLLQRHTFFKTNRIFLLLGLLTAFCMPFIIIPNYVTQTQIPFEYEYNHMIMAQTPTEETFTITRFLFLLYISGVIVFTIRLIIQLCSLIYFIKHSTSQKHEKYTYIKTTKDASPFSFFNWIVFNPKLFNEEELKQIIVHEKVHANQYHSIDILLSQLTCIILWFNPLSWLYNKDLKQNLEFIADENALRKSHCKKSYQYTLLKTSMPTHQLAITTNFYNSLIKKRIVMLHKSQSKKTHLLKYFLILPVLSLFLMSFNRQTIYVKKPSKINKTTITMDSNDIKIVFDKNLSDTDIENIKAKLKAQHITFTYSDLKRNSKGEIMSISVKFKTKSGFSTWNTSCDDKPIAPFYFYQSKDGMGVGQLDTDKKIRKTTKLTSGENPPVIIIDETPLIIIDDKESNKEVLDRLDKNSIQSVSVIKDDKIIKAKGYGNKAKDGVIIVSTKKDHIKIKNLSTDKAPIYIVDGKRISEEAISKIDPENIKSINVLKGDSATDKYNDEGRDGVIEITTKNKK